MNPHKIDRKKDQEEVGGMRKSINANTNLMTAGTTMVNGRIVLKNVTGRYKTI